MGLERFLVFWSVQPVSLCVPQMMTGRGVPGGNTAVLGGWDWKGRSVRSGECAASASVAQPWLACNFCWELQDKNASSVFFKVVSAKQVQALGSLW